MKLRSLLLPIGLLTPILIMFWFSNQRITQEGMYEPRTLEVSSEQWNGAAERLQRIRANQITGEVSALEMEQVRQQALTVSKKNAIGLSWSELGPDNFGGRTRALLVDQEDPNRLYAGSVSGGLFISTNGGKSWRSHSGTENFIVSVLVQASSGNIYMGTGSSFDATAAGGVLFPGSGLYKSTDHGVTFTKIVWPVSNNSVNQEWAAINAIAIDPTNENNIYLTTERGLRYTTDGGATWQIPLIDFTDIASIDTVMQFNQRAGDVVITGTGRVIYSVFGALFYSDNPTSDDPYNHQLGAITKSGEIFHHWGNSLRVELAVAPSNPSIVYSLAVTYAGALEGVYKSVDNGDQWERILSPIEGYFTPMTVDDIGSQGVYDLALVVSPANPNKIFIGGVQLWTYDGDLTRAASETGETSSSFYVHSDKHVFAYDPNDPKRLFVGTDGGVSLSPDGGVSWFSANRGYNVAQVYGLGFDNKGKVFMGTQDNGTLQLESAQGNSELDAERINGGDGFDCDYSSIADIQFATVYQSQVGRRRGTTEGDFAMICGENLYCGEGPFFTAIRLWESDKDTTSQDSVVFTSKVEEQAIGIGNGSNTFFQGTVTKVQESGAFVPNSITITTAGTTYTDNDESGVIKGSGGASVGSFDYETGVVVINLPSAPLVNKTVLLSYQLSYDVGATVSLKSNTPDVKFNVSLPQAVAPGDSLIFQDPIQSLLALSVTDDVVVSRNALDFKNTTEWWPLGTPGTAESLEFSSDGNHLFVATTEGDVYRASGLNTLYDYKDSSASDLVVTKIFESAQAVLDISVDPNNANHVLLTLGNYGNSEYVYFSSSALTTDTTDSFESVQGDLPAMPVYASIITVTDSNVAIIGTDVGVYATNNLLDATVSWSLENNGMPQVPVFDIRQQTANWFEAANHEVIYLGTHGRGVWKSSTLVGVPDVIPPLFVSDHLDEESLGKIYPNPSQGMAQLAFQVIDDAIFGLHVMDLQGRKVAVVSTTQHWKSGAHTVPINVALPAGIYQIVRSDRTSSGAKLVVR